MFRALKAKSPKWKFIPNKFIESTTNDSNPGRGWYRIYSFSIEDEVEENALKSVCCKEETLAMVQIDIGAYKKAPLDEEAMLHFRQIMQFFQKENKELILRIVYDRLGKGMEREPSSIHTICTHMKQVGVIVKEYANIIFTLQGFFIGSWGEMHSSKFLDKKSLKLFAQTLYEATEGSCKFAVRKPQQLRMLLEEAELREPSNTLSIGLYNDGMLASETDFGTYGVRPQKELTWEEAWDREAELAFQDSICRYVPNGGEVVTDNSWNDLYSAIVHFKKMHITYLHSLYDMDVLEKWKQSTFNEAGAFQGINGYDYIGAHLGYRFYITDAVVTQKKEIMLLTIYAANTGFANAYEAMQATLFIKEKEDIIKQLPIDTDVRRWNSGTVTKLSVQIENLEMGTYTLWLQLTRVKDQAMICFGNEGAKEALFLGKLFDGNRSE